MSRHNIALSSYHSETIQIVRTRNNTRKMRIKIAQTVCEPSYLPEKATGGGLVVSKWDQYEKN